MVETKVRIFQFKKVHTAIIDTVKTFIDPETIPDPEDPEAPDATILFPGEKAVRKTRPGKLSLYNSDMGIVNLNDTDIKAASMGSGLVAEVNGGLEVWIQGRSEKAEDKCKHYTDVARGYFGNKEILNMTGVTIKPIRQKSPKWASINLAPPTSKTPHFYTVGYVGFIVTISKRKAYTI